jgi:hypothetical protein
MHSCGVDHAAGEIDMSFARALLVSLLSIGGIAWETSVSVAGRWDTLLTVNKVDADPNKAYNLSEQNGPWMIMACSFTGEHAAEQAKALALELRQRYKLPAYVYEKKFDLGKEVVGRGVDPLGRPKRMKYQRGTAEVDEIAVLVGDYPTVDDPEGQEALRKVKRCDPACLSAKEGEATSRSLAGYRWLQSAAQKALLSDNDPRRQKGPMGQAFITTNPILPSDYYVPKGVDPLIVKANEGVDHSLLDCPGKYTVQVATFTGKVITNQKEIADIEKGKKEPESHLAKAAYMAHELTEALRMKGYEAFEFHDRSASIVTVGSFDSVGQPRADGKIEIDPRIKAIIDQFKSAESAQGMITARTLVKIPFDPQPVVVNVPKRTVSAALSQSPLYSR